MNKSLETRLTTLFEPLSDIEADLLVSSMEVLLDHARKTAPVAKATKKTGNPLIDDATPIVMKSAGVGADHPLVAGAKRIF